MTEGAEAPAPENPPAPNIDPNVKSPLETRVEMLEAGLKELLGIGKDAFDGLVARIDKLEAPPSPAPARRCDAIDGLSNHLPAARSRRAQKRREASPQG